jgi:hypothetical protein
MRSSPLIAFVAFLPFAISLTTLGCGDGLAPATEGQQSTEPSTPDAGGARAASSDAATDPAPLDAGTGSASDHPGFVAMTATVPSGVQCIVATMTGSNTETISTAVAAGAASATINFGLLNPGPVTVTANAFSIACPGVGTPSWVGDPVQATVVAGETAQIPLVLRAVASGTGSVTFEQPAISIALGPSTTFAVLADGTVRAWGSDANGEFGGIPGAASVTPGPSSSTPVTVQGVTNAIQVVAGNGFACAERSDYSVICWGSAGSGAFDTATTAHIATPVGPVVQPSLYVSQITAGYAGVAYTGRDGTVGALLGGGFSWFNYMGPAISVTPMSSGASGTMCTVTTHGTAQCLGASSMMIAETYLPATHVVMGIEGTGEVPFLCATLVPGSANATVMCWGANTYGELGTGSVSATPVTPTGSVITGAVNLAASQNPGAAAHLCVLQQAGTVMCSGSNSLGQLGDGTNNPSNYFMPVAGLTSAVEVEAGATHTCARRTDGSVMCWGSNDSGQLGDGTTTTRFSPVAVGAW